MIFGENTAAQIILLAGEIFVTTSTVAGITILVYFLCIKGPRAVHLITDDCWSFAKKVVPYSISFLVSWYLSLAFEKHISSSRLITRINSKHNLTVKVLLSVIAIVSKHYLFCVKSNCFRLILFVGNLMVAALLEVLGHNVYEWTAIHIALLLLFFLTVLILVRCICI